MLIRLLGVDFFTKEIKVGGRQVRLLIWDLAGETLVGAARSYFYSGASGAFVAYDVTRKETFNNVTSWIKELLRFVKAKVPVVLVGNKVDLRKQGGGHVSMEEGLTLKEELE